MVLAKYCNISSVCIDGSGDSHLQEENKIFLQSVFINYLTFTSDFICNLRLKVAYVNLRGLDYHSFNYCNDRFSD